MGEMDRPISLLERLLQHAETTARYAVYYGEGRDAYDIRGRTAHESIFNVNDGAYRCPNSQQGYSPFSTWTRGLAWILCGYPEEIEFLETLPDAEFEPFGGKEKVLARFLRVAEAVADFYLAVHADRRHSVLGHRRAGSGQHRAIIWTARRSRSTITSRSTAAPRRSPRRACCGSAAISSASGNTRRARAITRRALTVAQTLFHEPYLSTDPEHEGLLLHSVYHRPNGWDYIPPGQQGAVRRGVDVGRLPRARTGRDAASRGQRPAGTALLRHHV